MRTGVPGPEGSLGKWLWAEVNQALTELAHGPRAARAPCSSTTRWTYRFLRARANSIEGGTTEILKNIVAERVLGLPRMRMNFDLTDDQREIQRTAREFLAARYPPRRSAGSRSTDERGFTDDQWTAIAELGWPALVVPEDHGGLGLGVVELAVVRRSSATRSRRRRSCRRSPPRSSSRRPATTSSARSGCPGSRTASGAGRSPAAARRRAPGRRRRRRRADRDARAPCPTRRAPT